MVEEKSNFNEETKPTIFSHLWAMATGFNAGNNARGMVNVCVCVYVYIYIYIYLWKALICRCIFGFTDIYIYVCQLLAMATGFYGGNNATGIFYIYIYIYIFIYMYVCMYIYASVERVLQMNIVIKKYTCTYICI
jgi:hypothetical protein